MTIWQKKYRWVRTWGDETALNGRKREDYTALDGEEYIGRIFHETAGPTKGMWRWAGGKPEALKGASFVPNAGYKLTAEEAARTVEEYWDRMKEMT